MNATAKYFIDMLNTKFADFKCHLNLVFKNFWTDKYGHKFWTPSDVSNDMQTKKTVIVGIMLEHSSFTDYIAASQECVPQYRSYAFEYNWKEWGTFITGIDSIKDEPLTKFLESIFTQMLLLSDQSYNLFLGNELLMKKNTSYNHLMNIDMMSAVE